MMEELDFFLKNVELPLTLRLLKVKTSEQAETLRTDEPIVQSVYQTEFIILNNFYKPISKFFTPINEDR
jgi:hypothetical protein